MNNLFNLQEQYFFYKKYHLNTTNVLIHIGCIPMIMWSICIFLTHFSSNIFFNPTFLIVNLYSWYYKILDKDLGTILQILLYMSWISSYFFYWYVSNSLVYAMLLHVGAWIAQFIGHYYFEKNRPAFTDSLVQSFLIAPMFVLIDIQYLIKRRMSN